MAKSALMDGRQAIAAYIKAGTTQAKLAREVGCSEPHLSLILKGKRGLSLTLAKRLSQVTGVPIESLVLEAAE